MKTCCHYINAHLIWYLICNYQDLQCPREGVDKDFSLRYASISYLSIVLKSSSDAGYLHVGLRRLPQSRAELVAACSSAKLLRGGPSLESSSICFGLPQQFVAAIISYKPNRMPEHVISVCVVKCKPWPLHLLWLLFHAAIRPSTGLHSTWRLKASCGRARLQLIFLSTQLQPAKCLLCSALFAAAAWVVLNCLNDDCVNIVAVVAVAVAWLLGTGAS